MLSAWFGIDFGTSNSAVAQIDGDTAPHLVPFASARGPQATFPSVLHFTPREPPAAGWPAIERYLAAEHKGRFLQSLKAYLPDRSFDGTVIGTRYLSLEQLIAYIGRHIASALPAGGTRRAVLGRPVHFSLPADAEADAFAAARLREALRLAGFTDLAFEYEPVAAAYAYEGRLTRDERILIGDFGGGTSDFTVMAVGPGVRARGRQPSDILGTDGVPLAGDIFDQQIVRHLVAPRLGDGDDYLSPPDKILPVPSWPYERLERWHHLSFLRAPATLEILERVRRTAVHPERLDALLGLIRQDLGFQLHQAVQRTKFALSSADAAEFAFVSDAVTIRTRVTRADFEAWIADDVAAMAACVDRLMATIGLGGQDIDRVFLTGGSSFVPAVRRIFTDRFGAAKVTGGDELTSVATGLALSARERWPGAT